MNYPSATSPAIKNISFKIKSGEFVGFVGSSGAGKTSLADILLGVIQPSSGNVMISGVSPLEAVSTWPGSISYVPQDISISNGTVRENVSLGYPAAEVEDSQVWASLRAAELEDFVNSLPNKLDTQVGERGTSLSGGQRQRTGIALSLIHL